MRIVAVALVLIAAPGVGCESLRSGRPGDDWKPLFNGKDLTGWIVKGKAEDVARGYWTVDDGTILADSIGRKDHDYVWLLSEDEYADFELRLEFQAYRDSPGNSGVQIRSRYDDGAHWLDGPQVDIHPPGPWRTGMVWDETRGSQRWLFPPVEKGEWVDPSMAVPGRTWRYAGDANGWNDLHITCRGTRISASLNGLVVMEMDGAGILDDEIHRQREVGLRGHIALQIHRGDELRIRFRNVVLRDANEPTAVALRRDSRPDLP